MSLIDQLETFTSESRVVDGATLQFRRARSAGAGEAVSSR